MQQQQLQSSFSGQRRLDRASKHVSDLWFPVNGPLLKKIQMGLSNGAYDNDIGLLVTDLKGDFSLFLFCLRELLAMLRAEGISLPNAASPGKIITFGGIRRCRKVLSAEENEISQHSLRHITDFQRVRMEEAMVSASTAELLADKVEIDPDKGFSAALLRQLGYTLIAWNYPSVYERATASLKAGTQLDYEIQQILGFSPSLLAITVLRKWGFSEESCAILTTESEIPSDEDAEVAGITKTLAQICRVGEALARANHPEVYPSAQNDWEFARQDLERELGTQALTIVRERVRENCENYTLLTPHVFRGGMLLDPELKISNYHRSDRLRNNPWVEQCRPHLRKRLEMLYDRVDFTSISRDNIKLLARDIIPSAGFSSGCIYTVDPTIEALVPQMEIGHMALRSYGPVPYDPARAGDDDVIGTAFQCQTPVVEHKTLGGETSIACVAGVLGFSQRIGVVYLEIPSMVYNEDTFYHTIHFKAICQALNDCLNLK